MAKLFQRTYTLKMLKDFKNDYRFMSTEPINEKLKSVKFKGTTWDIEFEPKSGGDC